MGRYKASKLEGLLLLGCYETFDIKWHSLNKIFDDPNRKFYTDQIRIMIDMGEQDYF